MGIQRDTKKICDGISHMLHTKKLKTIRILLRNVIESENVDDMKEVTGVLINAELDFVLSGNSVLSDEEKMKKLVSELKDCLNEKTDQEVKLFNQIDDILKNCAGISEVLGMTNEVSIAQAISKGFIALKTTQRLLCSIGNKNINSTIGTLKYNANKILKDLTIKKDLSRYKKIEDLTMKILTSVQLRRQTLVEEEVYRITCEIFQLARSETDDIMLIEKLRDMLSKNKSTEEFKKQKKSNEIKESNWNSHLNQKICQLKEIMSENGLTGDVVNHNILIYKRNKKLQAVVEMLVLDILSILDTSKDYLENNMFYLDDRTPLLTGKSLRNHLAHDNILLDILLPDLSVAIFLNATKLLSENSVDTNKKLGKLVKDNPSNLKERHNDSKNMLIKQKQLFVALEEGRVEDLNISIRDGADINARSVGLRWSALHFASKGPSLECVKLILAHDVDIHGRDVNGQTAFHIAVIYARSHIVEFFLEKYDVFLDKKDNTGQTALHLAARHGHIDVVQLLLKKNANFRMNDSCGLPPLHHAILNNHIEIVKILWTIGPNVESSGGFTTLHQVAEYGCSEILRFLLENKQDVNSKNDNNYTPLHAAAFRGYQDVVKILVSKGANVNARNIEGVTPLHLAVEKDHVGITEFLIKNGAEVNVIEKMYHNTPLHYAAIDGYEDIAKILLQSNAKINATTIHGCTPLINAVIHGHLNMVIYLIRMGANIHAKDITGETPLIIAVKKGHSQIFKILLNSSGQLKSREHYDMLLQTAARQGYDEIMKILIEKGANVNSKGSGGTPLNLAVISGNKKAINLLIENNADVEARALDATPLCIAAFRGCAATVQMLLNNNALVDSESHGNKPIHFAICGGNTDIVVLLVNNEAPVDAMNIEGMSPLLMALVEGHKKIVRFLIEKGANVNFKSKIGTPLLVAIKNNDCEMTKLLIDNGADTKLKEVTLPSDITRIPIVAAIFSRNRDIVEVLLKTVSQIDMILPKNLTLLHYAVELEDRDMVDYLISKGGDVNARSLDGTTPLYISAEKGHKEIVEILIARGANVNMIHNDNGTPLHIAANRGHDDIVEILIQNGALVDIKDAKKRTPLQFAVANGHLRIVKRLIQTKNVDVNYKNKEDLSLLHIASQQRNMDIIQFLVDQGSDIHTKNYVGSKPIHFAARDGFLEAVQYYLSKGMHINERGIYNQSLLHYAALGGHLNVVNYLIQRSANVNEKDSNGMSPVHLAAEKDHLDCVVTLLKNDADYTAIDNLNRQAIDVTQNEEIISLLISTGNLFQAVKNNNCSEVENIIQAGSFIIDAQRADNGTVLHYAAWKGYDAIVKVLLENEANPNAICKNRITPLHYAAKFSYYNIAKLLLSYGAVYNPRSEKNGKTPTDLTEDHEISSLLNFINESFQQVADGNPRIVLKINKIENIDTVRAVMGARNLKNETLIVTAIHCNYPLVDKLKEVFQGDIGMQIIEGSNRFDKGDYRKALTVYKNMLERRKSVLGPNNPGTLDIESDIGKTLYASGFLKEAFEIFEKVYQKQKDSLGPNSADTLKTRSFIALLLHRLGRNTEALCIFEKVYAKQKTTLGENHSDTLNTGFHMALALNMLRKYDEALKINQIVFEKWKKLTGEESPNAITALNNIAMVLNNQFKFQEALKIYKDVLEKKIRVFGRNHSSTLKTMDGIAGVLVNFEKFNEAIEKYHEVWEIKKNGLGLNHPETMKTKYNIGLVYFNQGKWVSALKAFKEIYDKMIAVFGAENSMVIDITKRLKVIDIRLKLKETNTEKTIQNLRKDISIAAQQGDVNTAEKLLKEGVDMNETDMDGRAPIHYAVNSERISMVNLLLKNGADVTICTNKGNTSLHLAANNRNAKLVKLLLDHVNNDKLNDLINAKTTGSGSTALHIASTNSSLDIAEILLKQGAVHDLKNNHGESALDLATDTRIQKMLILLEDMFTQTQMGNLDVMRKLGEFESNIVVIMVNARNNQYKTLLQVAISKGHKTLVIGLLEILKKLQ